MTFKDSILDCGLGMNHLEGLEKPMDLDFRGSIDNMALRTLLGFRATLNQ